MGFEPMYSGFTERVREGRNVARLSEIRQPPRNSPRRRGRRGPPKPLQGTPRGQPVGNAPGPGEP